MKFRLVSSDTAILEQRSEYLPIASLIAGGWYVPAQRIAERAFLITAIRNRHRTIERVSIAVDGSPARGLVLVKLTGRELAIRTGDTSKVLTLRETRQLQAFAREIVAAVWGQESGVPR